MAVSGGEALAVGIWYQSIGAAAAASGSWQFSGAVPNTHGESLRLCDDCSVRVLIEYFDMDVAVRSPQGMHLVQFKVSSQRQPLSFGLDEVRNILCNATRAILEHDRESADPIVGFTVASNRPSGKYLAALARVAGRLVVRVNERESLGTFAEAAAPAEFFRESTNINHRNMRDLARNITVRRAKEWEVPAQDCISACLKAMANLAYATARPARLVDALQQWLGTWGILPHEYYNYVAQILGQLQLPSSDGVPWDELSIMRRVLDSPAALPLKFRRVWRNVIDDLRGRRWKDPPTPGLIRQYGLPDWMIDRSELLQGLPYTLGADTPGPIGPETRYSFESSTSPRIFALVGPGGAGKTGLLAQLFEKIGGGAWDWNSDNLRSEPQFIGYPVILEADEGFLNDSVSGVLRKWGGRKTAIDWPIERFAAANKLVQSEPAVWLGLDGIDELPDQDLDRLARRLANYADSHPNLRLVLTCRPGGSRDRLIPTLNAKGLVRTLPVKEFDVHEAREAVLRATNRELRLSQQPADFLPAGRIIDYARVSDKEQPSEFEVSMGQPLFIGVVRTVYEKPNGIELIQAAYDDNPDALRELAQEYVGVFCERLHRRLHSSNVTARLIFNALKQLASDVDNPQAASHAHWVSVCESELNGLVQWGVLNAQCAASGLIRDLGKGAFEWRHPFVGRYLPRMRGSVEWQ